MSTFSTDAPQPPIITVRDAWGNTVTVWVCPDDLWLAMQECSATSSLPLDQLIDRALAAYIRDAGGGSVTREEPMTDERMRELVAEWRASARTFIRRYAAEHTPHVTAHEVTLIEHAVGEVSVDEAMACLQRLEREAVAAPPLRAVK